MLKWCPCMGWCLTDPASGGEAKVLLNSMTTASYNVRRISSFGQTVINEAGEEEEVGRHGTLPTVSDGNHGPPWSANTVPVQPGVTKSDVAARMQRMASIPETSSPKSRNRLKKSLSESDHYVIDSPVRIRKKIHTPQEFAEISYHHDNESEVSSIKSESQSERSSNFDHYRSSDISNLTVSATDIESVVKKDSKTASAGSLFTLVKTANKANSLDRHKSSISPWMKKKNNNEKPNSPKVKSKITMDEKKEGLEERTIKGITTIEVPTKKEILNEKNVLEEIRSISREDIGFDDDEDDLGTISHSLSQSTVQIEDEDCDEVMQDGNRSIDSVEIAKQYGLDLNLYDLNDSIGLGGSRDDDLSPSSGIAKICFNTRVEKEKNQLIVVVEKVEGLGGEGSKNLPFDVTVKLGFLKGGHVYSTKPSSSNKSIDQTFSLHVKDFASSVLRLSVYNSAWQGSHDALGYSLFRVSKCTQAVSHHTQNISPKSNLIDSAGLIEVSFRYHSKILYIIIHKIFDILPAYRGYKLYTKVSLFISSKKYKEKISKTESSEKGYIMYDFESKFKADNITEHHTFLMISLKKKSENNKLFKHDKTLGRIFLGPLFYTGNHTNLWGQAILEEKIMTHTYSFYL